MPRPNRQSKEYWFDTFADMPLEDQAAALKILEQVHRLAQREAKRDDKPNHQCNDCGVMIPKHLELCSACQQKADARDEHDLLHPEERTPPRS